MMVYNAGDYEKLSTERDDLRIKVGFRDNRIRELEAAAKGVLAYYADGRNDESWHPEFQALRDCFPAQTAAQPGIGPMEPEPQDYKVQCRCGWMGRVSTLKSLPDFKMGCPDCSTEFMPVTAMTFPVDQGEKR